MLIGDTIILSLKNNLNITFTNNSTKTKFFYILNTFIVIMVGNMVVLVCS